MPADEETLLSFERTESRDAIATYLRTAFRDLDDDGTLVLDGGERTVTVRMPERATFEVEAEREETDDGDTELSVGFEVEWTETDEAALEEDGRDPVVPDDSNAQFQTYTDRAGRYRWRLVDSAASIVAVAGRGYDSRSAAEQAAARVPMLAPEATVVDVDSEAG